MTENYRKRAPIANNTRKQSYKYFRKAFEQLKKNLEKNYYGKSNAKLWRKLNIFMTTCKKRITIKNILCIIRDERPT